MLIMSIVFFTVLVIWDYKTARTQKQVISTLNEVDSKVSMMKKNFNKELEFHRIERDNLMLQQKQVLNNLQHINKRIEKKKSKTADTKELDDELNTIKKKHNGIKKT